MDRSDRPGGGVCILINKNIKYVEISTLCFSEYNTEVLGISILNGTKKVNFITFYRPPNNTYDNDSNLIKKLSEIILGLTNHSLIILGDLNLPKLWSNDYSKLNKIEEKYLNLFDSLNLNQLIDYSTMIKTRNINDVILVNNSNIVLKHWADQFEISDHKIINFKIDFCKNKKIQKTIYLYKKANYRNINAYLALMEWDLLFSGKKLEEMLEIYNKIILDSIELYIPKKNFGSKVGVKYPKKIRNISSKKKNAWKAYKNKEILKSEYKQISNSYKNLVNEFKMHNFKRKIKNENINSIYKLFKQSKHFMNDIPVIKKDDVEIIDAKQKANVFRETFSKNFGKSVVDFQHDFQNINLSLPIPFNIEPYIVEKILKNLVPKTTSCPDPGNFYFMKKCATPLAYPLSIIFKESLKSGIVPLIWKTAFIAPLFKNKGSRNIAENYRPVALTASSCRVLEKLILGYIKNYLKCNNIIAYEQFGFMPRKSCVLQLITTIKEWTTDLDKGNNIDVIYFDLEKAFDQVNHEILINKLTLVGINPLIIRWITNFLIRRNYFIKIDNQFSDSFTPLTGVPQGSVLGPILFAIYINDLVEQLPPNVESKLFADDLKIYKSVNSIAEQIELQNAIDSCLVWTQKNKMNFSSKKTFHLKLGKIKNSYTYKLYNETISSVSSIRDLGIIMDDKLNFREHIDKVVKLANIRQYNLFKLLPKKLENYYKILAYKTYVRPVLEYGTEVYNPYKIALKKKLEKPQRTFTKRLIGKNKNNEYTPYVRRLEMCKLDSTEVRRSKIDLITTFKIINNLYDVPSSHFFTPAIRHNRKHSRSVYVPHYPKLKKFQNFFSYRIINNWNNLPLKLNNHNLDEIFDYKKFTRYINMLPVDSIVLSPIFMYNRLSFINANS